MACLNHQADEKDIKWQVIFHSTMYYKHCLKYYICEWLKKKKRSAFFPRDWEIIYFSTLSFKCQFSASLYLAKSFFVEHKKKTKCPRLFFFFFFFLVYKIKKQGKFDQNLGIWSQTFPTIKLWFNGFEFHELRTSDWTTVCR